MILEFRYQIPELVIERKILAGVMGYEKGDLPELFGNYMDKAMEEAESLCEIGAVCQLFDAVKINSGDSTILADKVEFNTGNTVCRELENSEMLAFFICTAGKGISERSAALIKGEDPVLGYVLDILGSSVVEAACEKMKADLKKDPNLQDKNITNVYSPGYCNWEVVEQRKIFKIFDRNTCGVRLTTSCLMDPVKSMTGVIGIGKNVRCREYTCTLCDSENCIYRKLRGL